MAEIWGAGQTIYFPQLDLLVWALGLLQGFYGPKAWMRELARAMGSVTSPAKAAAARANGRKAVGGRARSRPPCARRKSDRSGADAFVEPKPALEGHGASRGEGCKKRQQKRPQKNDRKKRGQARRISRGSY
ncbi:hypothetical protein [Paraburkholderia sp. A1RO-5L]|uniref:hypothetical protein n=1 Tax=unclassified Paraburkholderia TaxID=2615204 RepID=UPI003B7FEA5E